jgi:predicted RNase H-like HicB family nuclease
LWTASVLQTDFRQFTLRPLACKGGFFRRWSATTVKPGGSPRRATGAVAVSTPAAERVLTDGATRHEALRNAEEMIDDYLETACRESWPVPQPQGRLAFS